MEGLLQRLSGASVHPEYRREAVVLLKDLLVENPKVGGGGQVVGHVKIKPGFVGVFHEVQRRDLRISLQRIERWLTGDRGLRISVHLSVG